MMVIINLIGSFFADIAKSFAMYLKGKKDAEVQIKLENLESELQAAKRLQNVKINTTRDAALERLRKHGKVRD